MVSEILPRGHSHYNPNEILPEEPNRAHEEHKLSSGVEVNGVMLPMNVAQQLRELGTPLEHYSPSELNAAIQACMIDGRLIDDPNGVGFMDMLVKDASEEQADLQGESMSYRWRSGLKAPAKEDASWTDRVERVNGAAQSYCERLLQERELNEEAAHKQGYAGSA
ncbi:MAG: hypothetical protein EBV03_05675 [Proteobacteria bacterium]|nr:hypothetical protein [Pseudomonadota bacterium]